MEGTRKSKSSKCSPLAGSCLGSTTRLPPPAKKRAQNHSTASLRNASGRHISCTKTNGASKTNRPVHNKEAKETPAWKDLLESMVSHVQGRRHRRDSMHDNASNSASPSLTEASSVDSPLVTPPPPSEQGLCSRPPSGQPTCHGGRRRWRSGDPAAGNFRVRKTFASMENLRHQKFKVSRVKETYFLYSNFVSGGNWSLKAVSLGFPRGGCALHFTDSAFFYSYCPTVRTDCYLIHLHFHVRMQEFLCCLRQKKSGGT